MSEKSKRRAAASAAKAAKKQAAKKQAETAKAQAASAPKKKTKVVIKKKEADQIGLLTEENLRKHNFKYHPRIKLIPGEPTISSMWAKATVPLDFIAWDIPLE